MFRIRHSATILSCFLLDFMYSIKDFPNAHWGFLYLKTSSSWWQQIPCSNIFSPVFLELLNSRGYNVGDRFTRTSPFEQTLNNENESDGEEIQFVFITKVDRSLSGRDFYTIPYFPSVRLDVCEQTDYSATTVVLSCGENTINVTLSYKS